VNSVTVTATVPTDTRETGNSNVTLDSPVPVLTAVSPSACNVGAFALSLTGAHFAEGATVFFGNTALATTYVSSTQLTATGTATSRQAGNVTITVQNPPPGPSVSAGIVAQVLGGIAVQLTPATSTVRAGAQPATLATWFGAGGSHLPAIFPNLANFPTPNLGFAG
jgi:hypothetical protein